jgi:hypothetical protein
LRHKYSSSKRLTKDILHGLVASRGENTPLRGDAAWPHDPGSRAPRPRSDPAEHDGRTLPLRPLHLRHLPSRGPEALDLPLVASGAGPTRS